MMPEIKPGDPTPTGPHVIVYPDGTRRHVYGGPNYRPPLTTRQRARVVRGHAWPWVLLAGVVAAIRYVIPLLTARHH